jgi:hypothetical protein
MLAVMTNWHYAPYRSLHGELHRPSEGTHRPHAAIAAIAIEPSVRRVRQLGLMVT